MDKKVKANLKKRIGKKVKGRAKFKKRPNRVFLDKTGRYYIKVNGKNIFLKVAHLNAKNKKLNKIQQKQIVKVIINHPEYYRKIKQKKKKKKIGRERLHAKDVIFGDRVLKKNEMVSTLPLGFNFDSAKIQDLSNKISKFELTLDKLYETKNVHYPYVANDMDDNVPTTSNIKIEDITDILNKEKKIFEDRLKKLESGVEIIKSRKLIKNKSRSRTPFKTRSNQKEERVKKSRTKPNRKREKVFTPIPEKDDDDRGIREKFLEAKSTLKNLQKKLLEGGKYDGIKEGLLKLKSTINNIQKKIQKKIKKNITKEEEKKILEANLIMNDIEEELLKLKSKMNNTNTNENDFEEDKPDEILTNNGILNANNELLTKAVEETKEASIKKGKVYNALEQKIIDRDFAGDSEAYEAYYTDDEHIVEKTGDGIKPRSEKIYGFGFGNNEGLWNNEIEKILKDKTKRFVPIICSDQIDLLEPYIKKPRGRFCWIMNTSKSTERGKHWVACCIDFDKYDINYYDSLATLPPKYVLEAIHKLILKFNPEVYFKLKVNRVKDQANYTRSCGYYASMFVIKMLKGASFAKASMFGQGIRDSEKIVDRFRKSFL